MRSVWRSIVWRVKIEEAGPPRSGTRINVLLNTKYTFAASMPIGIVPMPSEWTCAASKLKSTSCTGLGPHFGLEADARVAEAWAPQPARATIAAKTAKFGVFESGGTGA